MVLADILVEFSFHDCSAPIKSINVPNISKNNFCSVSFDFVPTQQEDLKGPAVDLAVWPWSDPLWLCFYKWLVFMYPSLGCLWMVKCLLKIYRVLMLVCVGSRGSLCVVWIISSAGSGCLCWIPGSIKLSKSDLMTENWRWVTVRMWPSHTNTAQPVSSGKITFQHLFNLN